MTRIILLLVATVCIVGSGAAPARLRSSDSFDLLILVQQWVGGYCRTSTCTTEPKGIDWWTLHGLWPTNDDGSYPSDCSTCNFDPSALSPIETPLDKWWPSYSGPNADFWSHEYCKHGTCAASVPQLSTEFDFFNTTLAIKETYPVDPALNASSIVPSQSKEYSNNAILNAINRAYGIKAYTSCSGSTLIEVNICISKTTLKAIDCSTQLISSSNCPSTVDYPTPPI